MVEQKNRWAITSYGDVVAVLSLLTLAIGVIAWGLKLESRNDALERRLDATEAQINNGILPRAEERIRSLESRMDRHEEDDQ